MSLTTSVALYQGVPTLHINGMPTVPAMAYVKPSLMHTFLAAGYQLFTAPMPRGWWVGPNQYDFTQVDQELASYTAQHPTALIMPRVILSLEGVTWWGELYPDEMAVIRDIATGRRVENAQPHPDTPIYLGHALDLGTYNVHSFHSKVWRAEASAAISAFVEHCEVSSFADRIWAYHIGDGLWSEWIDFHEYTFSGLNDYSSAAEADFASWLDAHHIPNDDHAPIPSPKSRVNANLGEFFDPTISERVIAYNRCHSEAVATTITCLCTAAKQAMPRPKVVGVFYGYVYANFPRPQVNGHHALTSLLSCPSVDFIASPHSYDHRGHGGYHSAQVLSDAVRRAGKLFLDEVDCKTMWTPESLPWKTYVSRPSTIQDTVEMLKKDAAFATASGGGLWWMDLTGDGWFDHPAAIEPLRRLREIRQQMLERPVRQFAEIAFVVDENALAYHRCGAGITMPFLLMLKQWHLSRLGAPFEQLLLTDLARPETPDYKLYIFPNLFHVGRRELRIIQNKVQRNNATAVWTYAPGFLGDQGPQVEVMQQLTGIGIRWQNLRAELNVKVTETDHPITQGLAPGFRYGTGVDRSAYQQPPAIQYLPDTKIAPAFYAEDSEATTLGYAESTGKPGLVVKEHPTWRSIYSSAPPLSWQLLQGIAQAAGVHIYNLSGDLMWANSAFLAVYSPCGGRRQLRLPSRCKVTDAYTGEALASDSDCLEIDFAPYETRLFWLD